MASQIGEQRGQTLRINVPQSLAQQSGGQPLFSPALPSALQTQFKPSMSHGLPHPLSLSNNMNTMQTPIQSQFFPQPVPFIPGHHQRNSIVGVHNLNPQFALQGPNPLPALAATIPLTPGFNAGFQQHQMPPHLVNAPSAGAQGGHGRSGSMSLPFNRNRRQGSVSLGGPPKATLGGPMNKHTAPPMTNPASSAAILEKTLKGKKLVVKVPNERPEEDGSVPQFARFPVPISELPHFEEPPAVDTATAALYPDEKSRGELPRTIEVFLPGKDAWEVLKRSLVEERLMKLGERIGVPPIFAHGVHGRAASISSPADPGLLMFKLNKLSQNQARTASPSITGSGRHSVSPGPHMQHHSPSPNHHLGPWSSTLGGNHRHSMSLANTNYSPQSLNSNNAYNPTGAFNPFGPAATLGSDQIISPSMSTGSGRGKLPNEDAAVNSDDGQIHAPRGVPGRLAMNLGRSDFIRGFGLDITEETEEEMEQEELGSDIATSEVAAILQENLDAIPEADEPPSNPGSRRHSRHTSRVSAALSLRSLGRGGKSDSGIPEEEEGQDNSAEAVRAWGSEGAARSMGDDEGADAANEWTASDDESIGEYSNPSDEERARAAKRNRLRARAASEKTKPAGQSQQAAAYANGTLSVPPMHRGQEQDSEDIVSNPSEEERLFNRRPSTSRPLPAIPTSASHSRMGSGQMFTHSRSGSGQPLPHLIPLPHSRTQSGQFNTTTPPVALPEAGTLGSQGFASGHRESLNPNARPFVFGKPWYSSTSPNPPPSGNTPPAAVAATSRLSVAAPEFKPSFSVPESRPSVVAKEFKPSPSASEFKPTYATSELKPQLPSIEFQPSGLAGAFRSNPGSGDFTPTLSNDKAGSTPNTSAIGTSQFTFRPPAVAPQLSFPAPVLLAEPDPPVNAYGRVVQGREKRPRKESNPDVDLGTHGQANEDAPVQELVVKPREDTHDATPIGADSLTWNSLTTYKFPHEEEAPTKDPVTHSPGPESPNKIFTFPPTKKSVPTTQTPVTSQVVESPDVVSTPAPTSQPGPQPSQSTDSIVRARSPRPPPLNELPKRGSTIAERPTSSSPSTRPTSARMLPQPPQRAQTVFNDYKPHSVSSNTVPASLFKNLPVSNVANGGMDAEADDEDDDEKPLSTFIAKLSSHERFDHGQRPSLDDLHMPMIARKAARTADNREFSPKVATEAPVNISQLSVPAVPPTPVVATMSPRSPVQENQRNNGTMDEKMDVLRNDIRNLVESYLLKVNSATSTRAEEALVRIARLMRDQAAEKQGQDDIADKVVARSALDPEAIRTIIQESNKEVCATIQKDLVNFAQDVQEGVQTHPGGDILRTVEEQASRIINAVSGATMNLATRLEAVHSMVELPAGGNGFTASQSHAVGHTRVPSHEELLRVLRPHLEELRSMPFDVDVVTARLADAVKPTLADFIDLVPDKGETADLIVAKLGPALAALRPSRLDTQDIAGPAAQESQYLFTEIRDMLQQYNPQESVSSEELTQVLRSHLEPIIATQSTLVQVTQQSQNMLDSSLSDIFHSQDAALNQLQDLLASSTKILNKASVLPDHIAAIGQSSNLAQAEFLSKLRSLPDLIDLQNQKMDLQVQLTKAIKSHGQVRSEKDVLGERVHALEGERERLRIELQSLKSNLAEQESEVAVSSSKAEQAEKALQQALSRVEMSEAVAKTLNEQVLRMEGVQRELQRASNERQAQVDSLELQLKFASRDKELAQESLRRVEQERDAALEQQQESWREIKLNSQKIDSLLQLSTAKESDELRELRRQKDRVRGVEAELTSARKRIAELESKVETLIRSDVKSAQDLDESQRQVEELESKLEKLQREIEPLRRLDEAQKTRDKDFEEIRTQLQMQEKQEDLLRQNNVALQEELAALRNELELSRKAQATAKWQQHQAKEPATPPYARAAPGINGRSHIASRGGSSRSTTPPATHNGVWTSMHAPSKTGKTPSGYQSMSRSAVAANGHHPAYGRAPSPAQSVVSQAPTLREDGWWE